jgi:hypothetical protein
MESAPSSKLFHGAENFLRRSQSLSTLYRYAGPHYIIQNSPPLSRILSQPNPLQTYPLNKAFPQTQKTQSFIICLIVILDSIIRIQLKPEQSEMIMTVESAMTPGQQTISAINITCCHS